MKSLYSASPNVHLFSGFLDEPTTNEILSNRCGNPDEINEEELSATVLGGRIRNRRQINRNSLPRSLTNAVLGYFTGMRSLGDYFHPEFMTTVTDFYYKLKLLISFESISA